MCSRPCLDKTTPASAKPVQLQEEHRRFDGTGAVVDRAVSLADWRAVSLTREEVRRLAAEFAAMNRGHVELEETLTYPAARGVCSTRANAGPAWAPRCRRGGAGEHGVARFDDGLCCRRVAPWAGRGRGAFRALRNG